jgi:hypothetical protein
MLQNGHIGWYSVKLVLHLGQYQAMASSLTLISDVSLLLDIHFDDHEPDQSRQLWQIQSSLVISNGHSRIRNLKFCGL